jgi:hypothetical protein
MHPSVIELRNRLFGYATADSVPLPALRDEVLALHHAIEDEESRIELMRLFNVIADLVEAYLAREGGDLDGFRMHRHGQIWHCPRAESLVDGELDRARLLYVKSRACA